MDFTKRTLARLGRSKRSRVGLVGLGVRVRTSAFALNRDRDHRVARSTSSFWATSTDGLGSVWDDCGVRPCGRTATSFVVDLLFERRFPELDANDWRTAAGFAAESDLVWMGRLHDCGRAFTHLVRLSEANVAAEDCSHSSCRDFFPDDMAGALGLFFHVDLCDRVAKSARTDQVAGGSLDRIHIVDLSDPARLGRANLAERSGTLPAKRASTGRNRTA